MVPCGAFEPGDAADNTVVRAFEGPIAAIAMKDPDSDNGAFVLRNLCDDDGECQLDKLMLPELSPGSQVMLTTGGHFLVGIDQRGGTVWTYEFDDAGRRVSKNKTYVDPTQGPAQLVIGLRDSELLVVRDREGRLGVYRPTKQVASPIAPDLGDSLRLAAVGERWVAVRVLHADGTQTVYVVDVEADPERPYRVATGDIQSVVFGPGDATVVLSAGTGVDASVMVFDVGNRELLDAFTGELISSRERNDRRAVEEVPGLHAISPSGEQLAYRTPSGSLAVRQLLTQSSCIVRNTNRLGTGAEPSRNASNHALAGFGADGMLFAEYTVGSTDSFVYAYDPRHQQITPLGSEEAGWHLAAVPGRVTDVFGEVTRLWAVGVRHGSHATIGEGRIDGHTVGRELTFMPLDDEAVWAIDTKDELVGDRRSERALSVRRVAPPEWKNGALRFEQGPDDQVIPHVRDGDNQGPLRVPLSGRLCLTTGVPGAWAYRCGDSTGTRAAFTTDSGTQEQNNDPNVRPEFDPPFPDQGEGDGGTEPDSGDGDPTRD